jgi:hypothetical protein
MEFASKFLVPMARRSGQDPSIDEAFSALVTGEPSSYMALGIRQRARMIGDRKGSRRNSFMGQDGAPGASTPREAADQVDSARAHAIRSALQGVVEGIRAEVLETTSQELGGVLRGDLSVVPVIGQTMSRGELLTQIVIDLEALDSVANRLERGAASNYMTAEAAAILEAVHAVVKDKLAEIPRAGQEPIAARNRTVSDEHLDRHVGYLKNLSADVDRMIVEAESSGVAVREPSEKQGPIVVLAGLALLGVAAYGLYHLLAGGD